MEVNMKKLHKMKISKKSKLFQRHLFDYPAGYNAAELTGMGYRRGQGSAGPAGPKGNDSFA
jgi:hypothetical protein